MSFHHPGLGQAASGAVSPRDVKIDAFASLKHLFQLQMRSKAPQLKSRLALSMILVLAGKALGVWAPLVMGHAINLLAAGKATAEQVAIAFTGFILLWSGLRLVSTLAPNIREAIFSPISQAAQARAAHETFAHALALSVDFHQSKQTGSLARVIDRGARSMDFLLRSFVFNLGPTAIELVLAAVVLTTHFDWRFAVVALVTVVIYAWTTFAISDWRIAHRREMNEAESAAAGISVDAFINYETVKSFGAEDRSAAAYDGALQRYARSAVKSNTSMALLNSIQTVIMSIGLTLLAIMAGVESAHGRMGPGDVTAAIQILLNLYMPLNFLGFTYREIRQSFIDMEKMLELRAQQPDIADGPDSIDLPPARDRRGGKIVFADVGFQHGARSSGLEAIDFVAEPGTTTALVGPSGAGKTTIVRLAMRLIDPKAGGVRLDGVDLRQVRKESLHQAVALVPQDVALFNSSLYANIAFAQPDATPDQVRAAADAAELGPFIDALPKGMSTPVGERGLKLSGGERQRVGIARALLANPRVLILDEATSALDSRTEEAIQATLKKAREGRTTLVIAHRLSTIVDADQILVLKKGQIVERGTHAELLATDGEYASLWRRQTRGKGKGPTAPMVEPATV
ncbi:MAG: metal transporter permease [Caulobacteraceae bacterium]|nr:metal transporter permease [Caulobacteraceae bacterium]